ncbi:MFS transporter [Amylibacter marinus]|uniref:MFS transporter n=1 Tax=Amylibacter marinus TaxID=1475483 RepID=A0ABQ5VRQ3_9RHOB|nr:MFS transporter [Amylibacter marinus]GLQ34020.1 MFS transporter [Amylibacter marinus]
MTALTPTAKRNLILLVCAQAFLGAQMPMIFVVAGLAGQSMASNICWATLPISLIVFGSMTTAPWLANVMQKLGRKAGFLIGALGGVIGAILCAYALHINSFSLFLLGSYFTGIYMSAQGFFRFAAVDSVTESFRPKAISYVMAGGLISAVFGPQLVKLTAEMFVVPFLGVYLAVVMINLLGAGLFMLLDIPRPAAPKHDALPSRSRLELLKTPRIAVAIICGMVSYALMNLVMTSTPLAVVGCGYTQNHAADVVMAHVLGMFVPSFFTGHLIARYGSERIVFLGLMILALAGVADLAGVALANFYTGLILLGIGWNFGFIGATSMLASAHRPEEQGAVQGMNDFFVFGFVTLASLASGGLMNCSGGTPIEGWTAVNLAMIPFILIASGALFWLSRINAAQPST